MTKLVHCTENSKWIVLIYAFISLDKISSENIANWTLKIYVYVWYIRKKTALLRQTWQCIKRRNHQKKKCNINNENNIQWWKWKDFVKFIINKVFFYLYSMIVTMEIDLIAVAVVNSLLKLYV